MIQNVINDYNISKIIIMVKKKLYFDYNVRLDAQIFYYHYDMGHIFFSILISNQKNKNKNVVVKRYEL
jgi:hypothetical protein